VSFILLYVVTAAAFLGIDAVWLKKVAGPMFRREIGSIMLEDPRFGVAGVFYAAYCAGIVYFAALPAAGDPWAAFRDGAILGLLAYGTYEATNLSTLKGWTARMAAVDTIWGAALSGFSAALAVWLVG
jgi:uncharacterized membrane protein